MTFIAHNSGDIVVTHSAAAKIYELKEGENNPELKLRIFVTGGGCSGFQYGFGFEEKPNPDDFIFTKNVNDPDDPAQSNNPQTDPQAKNVGVFPSNAVIEILVDAISMQYLKAAKVDYRKDIHGEQFIISNNPNAKTTCGCGASFSAADDFVSDT